MKNYSQTLQGNIASLLKVQQVCRKLSISILYMVCWKSYMRKKLLFCLCKQLSANLKHVIIASFQDINVSHFCHFQIV